MTCLGVAGWEEQAESPLEEPLGCFKGLDCGCGAHAHCGVEREPEGRGWRSCLGGDPNILPVGAQPPPAPQPLVQL